LINATVKHWKLLIESSSKEDITKLNWTREDRRDFEKISVALGVVIVSFTREVYPIVFSERRKRERRENLRKALMAHQSLSRSVQNALDPDGYMNKIMARMELEERIQGNQ